MIHYIDKLLLNWATWSAKREDNGQGYPKKSIYCQLVHIRSDQDGHGYLFDDENALEIDGIVAGMKSKKPEWYCVVDWHYRTGADMTRKLKECGYSSKTTFYNKLHQAHLYIMDALHENDIRSAK